MDIKKLYKDALASVTDDAIVISTDSHGPFSSVCEELSVLFSPAAPSVSSFKVKAAILQYEEPEERFSIFSRSQCEVRPGLIFQQLIFSGTGVELTFGIPDLPLDLEKRFILSNCGNAFSVLYHDTRVTDKISGTLIIHTIQLSLTGIAGSDGTREFRLKEQGTFDVSAFLADFFEYCSIPQFLTPDIPLRLQEMEAVFEPDSSEGEMEPNDSFAVSVSVDCSFGISDIFKIRSLALCFEKYGCEYALGLKGEVEITGLAPMTFFARYESAGSYLFGVAADGDEEFGFERIAKMTGVKAAAAFPQELSQAKGLKLSRLMVQTDFKKIDAFQFGIAYAGKWLLCRSPEFALSDVELGVYIRQKQGRYTIAGTATLFGKDFRIQADYDSADGWLFRCSLSPYQNISLGEIAGEAARLCGVSDFAIPLDLQAANLYLSINLAGEFTFTGLVLAGSKTDQNLAKIFNGRCVLTVKNQKKDGDRKLTAKIEGTIILCGSQFQLSYENEQKKLITAVFTAGDRDQLSLKALIKLFGDGGMELPDCFNLSLTRASLSYTVEDRPEGMNCGALCEHDFIEESRKILTIEADLNVFAVKVIYTFKETPDYQVTIDIREKIDLGGIPVAGQLLAHLGCDTSISAFRLSFSKEKGLKFACRVCGQDMECTLAPPEAAELKAGTLQAGTGKAVVKWIAVNKNLSAFYLNRLGISMEGQSLGIKVDASLQISPLTFDLMGVGISAKVPEFRSVRFLMDGFGVSFHNETLSVSGAFLHREDAYIGELEVALAKLSIVAVGEYRKNSLMAYAVLSYPLGGPPCFVVTGLAASFGYNKKLKLPGITEVKNYPLVAAAMGDYDKSKLITELGNYITTDPGMQFLAAGVRFTSFEIVKGFLMATVAFGKETEIGLLGLADIVMPPKCEKTPIAKAQLALKIAILPKAGLASCEARLTEDSYILSQACTLTGGFAFYLWFGGEHKGDFVLTLGGYHPAYKKPVHYPDVPRLGFRWDVLPTPNQLVMTGEIYFALTPSAIMAGGKLSVVYKNGNLKAYFIAYADFLLQWQPFAYDIRIGVMLGASYRVDWWFVHHTFTIELAADLHIWGPEFAGTAHVKWFILSFTIPFGNTKKESVQPLDWKGFKESFIPDGPLSLKLKGADASDAVRADDLQITVETTVPAKEVAINGKETVPVYTDELHIQPMSGMLKDSLMTVSLVKKGGEAIRDLEYTVTYGNVPSALWGEKGSGKELIRDVPAGVEIKLPKYTPVLFPEDGDISEELLTEAQKLVVRNAFPPAETPPVQEYMHKDTIKIFMQTAVQAADRRTQFLHSLGYEGKTELGGLAAEADRLFDDDILIGSVSG